jgi:transcriptional regulator with XRE-family HTH domain
MAKSTPFHSQATIDAAARLGDRLRRVRKAQRRTLADLEHACRLHRQTLARLERGDPSVSLAVFLTVMEALGELADLELLVSQPGEPRPVTDSDDEPLPTDF